MGIKSRSLKKGLFYKVTLPNKEEFIGQFCDKGEFDKNTPTACIFYINKNSDKKKVKIAYLNQSDAKIEELSDIKSFN